MISIIFSLSVILFFLLLFFLDNINSINSPSFKTLIKRKDKLCLFISFFILLSSFVLVFYWEYASFITISVVIYIGFLYGKHLKKLIIAQMSCKFDIYTFDFILVMLFSFLWIPIIIAFEPTYLADFNSVLIFEKFSIFNVLFTYTSGILVGVSWYVFFIFLSFGSSYTSVTEKKNKMSLVKYLSLRAHVVVGIISMVILLFVFSSIGTNLINDELYVFDKIYSTIETLIFSLIIPTLYSFFDKK